jgi:hypothetical protein
MQLKQYSHKLIPIEMEGKNNEINGTIKLSAFIYFSIDKDEFRNWVSTNGASTYESGTNAPGINIIGQTGLTEYEAGSSGAAFESSSGINASYAAAASSELVGSAAIQTTSEQQTTAYLTQTATGIYNDPNPQIVRRAATEGPITYQQKILVRFLQPPAVPPPGVIHERSLHRIG